MQIIISQATAQAINTGAAEIVQIITGETPDVPKVTDMAVTDMANWSVTTTASDIVYEVNDELFFKYVAVYLKVAKIVAPFIKPIMALIETLSADVRDIERFMSQKK